jgi:predicted dehydrogenase
MALTAGEIDQLAEVAGKVHIMEGFMVRHSLQWLEARRLIREGIIGAPKIIQSWFSYSHMDAGNIRNKVEWGGGGLMDIGGYPIVAGRFFFETDPLRVMVLISRDATFGTDHIRPARFGRRQLTFAVSTALTLVRPTIIGDKRVSHAIPFNQLPTRRRSSPSMWRSFNGATA